MWMRFPKRGFRNFTRIEYACINVDTLDERYAANAVVTPEALQEIGLIRGRGTLVKILGRGELTRPLTVRANRFTAEAERKIVEAGGKVEVI